MENEANLSANNAPIYSFPILLTFAVDCLSASIFLLIILIIIAAITLYPNTAIGQTISGNETTQLWIDRENNVKIQFRYLPEKPIINTPTELKFDVLNLQTGSHLKNFVIRVVIVTNSSGQERTFKFTNMTSLDGNFSVKYLFPDWGIYQVISRIDSNNVSALASFKVLVPIQPLGIINVNYLMPLLLPAELVGIIGAIAVGMFLIITRSEK